MVDELVAAAGGAGGPAGVGAWARVENAAAARRLWASAQVLEAAYAADGSAEREQWCVDNWDAVCAEIAAAQNVSLGVASHQLLLAIALRERLPRLGEVFAAGLVSLRLVNAIVFRTGLVKDPGALAEVDAEVAGAVSGWGALSVAKAEQAIDYWVQRYDPLALRRVETCARGRHVDIHVARDGSGVAYLEAVLLAQDGQALDQRLDAMAAAVCAGDPRSHEQRRADAAAALGHGADRLRCGCGSPDCAAAGEQPSAVVVHVIAEQAALDDDTAVAFDGAPEPGPPSAELQTMTVAQALAPDPPTGPAAHQPGMILGGGLLPAPLLAAKLAGTTAKLVPIVHPGAAPPQQRYIPTAVLAWFIRARDLTCRFPGCDAAAHLCDIDHTIPYPHGPTQASNLKCLCRKHHLLKTFWGWRDHQHPDGTVVWTSPSGQTYTTHPGSRLLFPSLCRPTAPVTATDTPDTRPNRTLMMPRRTTTRAHDRAARNDAERQRNRINADPAQF
ncbi:HNH endonuclease signature motif containing protein [Mycobacterium deserti]|uniref:HNH endonuclease n=1 Tax=Mycobacterium deserti TaxID=2978347 RepID=A0ABT2M474_9MYCO|nr:HNH endonuclease signature motif containing protein [Mycobacterium deserti]MCT7657065.1 HNH endonuclease [Mycobacterium deserti]